MSAREYRAALMTCAERYRQMVPEDDPDLRRFVGEFEERTADYPLLKLSRWLGYIQGALIAGGWTTVEAERNWSRPLFRPLDFPGPMAHAPQQTNARQGVTRELARLDHDGRLLAVYQSHGETGPRLMLVQEDDPARQSVVLTTHEVRWLTELWRPTDEAADAVIEAAEEWAHDSTPETRLRLLVAVEMFRRSAADEPGETP